MYKNNILKVLEVSPECFIVIIDTNNITSFGEINLFGMDKDNEHVVDEDIIRKYAPTVIKIQKQKNDMTDVNLILYVGQEELVNITHDFKLTDNSFYLGHYGHKVHKFNKQLVPKERHALVTMVLHTHMPFIKHIDGVPRLEQRWLYEALLEVYLPLLHYLEMAEKNKVHLRYTLSLSPTIMEMFNDEQIMKGFTIHLNKMVKLSFDEIDRTSNPNNIINSLHHDAYPDEVIYYNKHYKKFNKVAEENFEELTRAKELFNQYDKNVLNGFKRFADAGMIELMVSAGTHTLLPLIEDDKYVTAHLKLAMDAFEKEFGYKSKGVWLPENGYVKGMDKLIKDAGFEFFFLEAHGIDYTLDDKNKHSSTLKIYDTPSGAKTLSRNILLNNKVWDKITGYPGHGAYKEFERDIGFDLNYTYLKDHLTIGPEGRRHQIGIKYHATTSLSKPLGLKEPYSSVAAAREIIKDVNDHHNTAFELLSHAYNNDIKYPVFCEMFDTELFGHWWKEGPVWLYGIAKIWKKDTTIIKMATVSEAIARQKEHDEFKVIDPITSSWGSAGYFDHWFNSSTSWYWLEEWDQEKYFDDIMKKNKEVGYIHDAYVNQAFRELLLFQTSDWSFMITNEVCVEYAKLKVKTYATRFYQLYQYIMNGKLIPMDDWITMITEDSIFDRLDYKKYFK